jgi:cytoplasmic iron level regulating protein YaaA (DUF328/UPF0246 family)
MLIIISPAKTLDYESPLPTSKHTLPDFLAESGQLVEELRELSPPRLAELMGVSNKLADLNFGRYLNWQRDFTPDNARQAVLAFKGDVYTGLQAEHFSMADFNYAQKHLRILSGLYGVLRPLDLMQPYRLEMGTKFENSGGKNLYEFWGDKITDALNAQLKKLKTGVLVNLASNEYFKAVKPAGLNAEIVTPEFRDWKNGKYKMISFYAKKARGLMSAWLIQNRVDTIDGINDFDEEGYQYDAGLSSPLKPVFTRKQI